MLDPSIGQFCEYGCLHEFVQGIKVFPATLNTGILGKEILR